MNTVIVKSSRFNAHYPVDIPKNTVNAEAVLIRLDSEWDGLTVRIHWLNVASKVEKNPLLERDKPNTIPWEVLADLGELRMGLVGLDGETVIKPTIWLTYGYVVDGVDPEAGDDPQPPTPSWEQQMVEQAKAAAAAAEASKDAAEKAGAAAGAAAPYADEAKKSAEAAKASQDASATSARQANEAAQAAKDAAGSIGDSVDRAEGAATEAGTAKQAAETAQAAASNSAGTAQGAATTASKAAQTAKEAATQAGEYLATVKEDADNAESAALEAGKSQEAARDSAQEAANARDQATTAATTADTAKDAAEQAATTAGNAQSGAAQSAQAAANSAQAAERAKQEAQNAAAAFPAPSPEVAGMVPMVNQEGNGYIFGEAGGGGAGGELLQTISGENYGNIAYNFPEERSTFFVVGTLAVNADKGTVVVYQDVKTYDKKIAYLPFWDFYGQEGKTLRVHLVFERVRIGEDGTSLLRLSGVVSSADTDGPGRRSTYLQSPWTDIDSSGLKLGLFSGFRISGTFDSVNLRVYGA